MTPEISPVGVCPPVRCHQRRHTVSSLRSSTLAVGEFDLDQPWGTLVACKFGCTLASALRRRAAVLIFTASSSDVASAGFCSSSPCRYNCRQASDEIDL